MVVTSLKVVLNSTQVGSLGNDTMDHVPLSPEVLLLYQVMVGTLSIGGFISNTLTCVAVFGFRRLRNAGNIFIANLSLGGVVYCALVLPVRLATLINNGWVWKAELCVFFGTLGHFLAAAIAFAFGGIAANRLVYIRYSAQYVKLYSPRGVTIQILSLWLLSLVLAVVLPLSGAWGTITYHPMLYCCTFSYDEDISYKYFITSFCLYTPTVFAGICYLLIFLHVKKAQRGVNKWSRAIRRMTAHKIHVVPTPSGGLASVTENSSTVASSSETSQQKDVHDESRTNTKLTFLKGESAGSPQHRTKGEFEAIVSVTERDSSVSNARESTDDTRYEGLNGAHSAKKITSPSNELLPNSKEDGLTSNDHVQPTETQGHPIELTTEHGENHDEKDQNGSRRNSGDEGSFKPESPKKGLWTVQGPTTTQKVVALVLSNKQRKEAIRVTLMIVCASFMCVTCTLPYYIVDMLHDRDHFPLGYMVAILSIALALNLNPLVYALMNARYRRTYKEILSKCFRCRTENISKVSPEMSMDHM